MKNGMREGVGGGQVGGKNSYNLKAVLLQFIFIK